jgi:pimeloyl-ACP methyl ester carboxylesterase
VRAREPDRAGHVVRDGVAIGYEEYGSPSLDGRPTVLLLPTWTIIHSRFWKFQVPYLARHFHVVTFDGPGNGRSDRPDDPSRYSASSVAADAAAVLDACGSTRAVAVGLSMGAGYALVLATMRPQTIAGLVLVGPSLALAPVPSERAEIERRFHDPAPIDPKGWEHYNLAYWHAHYAEFVQYFFEQVFSEPHSTKPIEDAVGWASTTTPSVLESVENAPPHHVTSAEVLADLHCPILVVHGTRDRITSHAVGVEAARLANGALVSFEGSGHIPNVRDPVRFNHLVREFVERVN